MATSTSPSLGRSSAGSAKTGPPTARSRPRTDVIVRKSRRVEPSTSRQSLRRPLPFPTLPITARTGASNRLHCTFYSKSLRSSRESRNASRSRCGAALLRASSRGGTEGDPTRSARKRPPPIKIETPLGTPPFLTSHRCGSRASTRAFFALVSVGIDDGSVETVGGAHDGLRAAALGHGEPDGH